MSDTFELHYLVELYISLQEIVRQTIETCIYRKRNAKHILTILH
jgi:hypothetical protein